MKLYSVTCNYEDIGCIGIYTTKEKAIEVVRNVFKDRELPEDEWEQNDWDDWCTEIYFGEEHYTIYLHTVDE